MLLFDQLKKNDPILQWMAVAVLTGIMVLLSGVLVLQVFSSRAYVESQKNQSLRSVRVPALRGKILDRNGVVLADNRPSYRVVLYLEELRDLFQGQYRLAKGSRKLARSQMEELGRETRFQVVSNLVAQIGTLLEQPLTLNARDFARHFSESLLLPLPVLEDLDARRIALFQETPQKPQGLNLEVQPLRHYPFRSSACHVLGYLGRARSVAANEAMSYNYPLLAATYQGLVGVEGAFDADLRGRAGGKFVIVNNLGYRQTENVWAPAEPGQNLTLTIDCRVQQAAEKALRSLGTGIKGAVVVLNCQNGDVLALASVPAYDPNLFVPRLRQDDWEQLNDPEALPVLNRATYGTYQPGSIFKILVSLACLETGLNPAEILHNPGYYQLGRRTIDDEAPAGEYDFKRAFKLSSNTYFIHFGLKAGLAALMEMGAQFHFGQSVNIPLRQDSRGSFPTEEYLRKRKAQASPWMEGDTANLCLGQAAITVTPLQVALMTAGVANGGRMYWPRLVQRIDPQDPDATQPGVEFPAGRLRSTLRVSERSLEIVRQAMLADVEDPDGTGRRAGVPGFRVCGKTGTAQVKQGGRLIRHDTWFASYAPFENPRYVVVVLVEGGDYGSTTCAPVARQVYELLHRLEKEPSITPELMVRN